MGAIRILIPLSVSLSLAGCYLSDTLNNGQSPHEVSGNVTALIAPGQGSSVGPVTIDGPSPRYTSSSSIAISGTCQQGFRVSLRGEGSVSQTCSGSQFHFDVSQSQDGQYAYSVIQADATNVESAPQPLTWIRDTTPPAAVVLTSPSIEPYVSSSSWCYAVGRCEPGGTVTMDGADQQTKPCTSGGTISLYTHKTVDATYTFDITQTDRAGNVSRPTRMTWIKTNTLPNAPTILSPAANPLFSNSSSVTVTGGCTSGATVVLSGEEHQNAPCIAGAYSFTIVRPIDGTYSFSILQTTGTFDSPSTLFAWIRDSSPPAPPVITFPPVSPYVSADNALVIAGTCEPRATVHLSGSFGHQTAPCGTGAFGLSIQEATDGDYDYWVWQTDLATNASRAVPLRWVRDTAIPVTPTVFSPATNPFYSNADILTIAGACTSDFTVILGGADAQRAGCAASSYLFTSLETVDGPYVFAVKQVSPTNLESAQALLTWVRDTIAPVPTTIRQPPSSPYTSSGNLLISGDCEIGGMVILAGDDAQTVACTEGLYAIMVSRTVEKTYYFWISQKDMAGNVSAAQGLQWTYVATAPPAPVVVTPPHDPYISNTSEMRIAGQCLNDATVTLMSDVGAPQTQTCEQSAFSFTVKASLNGTYAFSVDQTRAGLTSGAVHLTWTRDTVAPETAITSGPPAYNHRPAAEFRFSMNESGSVFECRFDLEDYAPCTSPMVYSGTQLSGGAHTFSVRATDTAGNVDPNPASMGWTQSPHNTVALYHFDNAVPMADSSGNSNSLTDSGTTSAVGRFAEGRRFSGLPQYLSSSDNSSLGALDTTMTLESWVKFHTVPEKDKSVTMMSRTGPAGRIGWEFALRRHTNNKLYIAFRASLDGVNSTETRTRIVWDGREEEALAYHHYAVTWDRGELRFFLDGELVGSGSIGVLGTARIFDAGAELRIGRNEIGEYLDADYDEIRVSRIVRWKVPFVPASEPYAAD